MKAKTLVRCSMRAILNHETPVGLQLEGWLAQHQQELPGQPTAADGSPTAVGRPPVIDAGWPSLVVRGMPGAFTQQYTYGHSEGSTSVCRR